MKAGSAIGHYDVTSLLGEGGMGQFERRRTPRLPRVA